MFLADLLSSGTLQHHANSASSVEQASHIILQILAHYFNRFYLPFTWKSGKKANIQLRPLPQDVEDIISQANQKTILLFIDYLRSLIGTLDEALPIRLPFSQVQLPQWIQSCKYESLSQEIKNSNVNIQYQVRSPFFALRGKGDEFDSVQELIEEITPELEVDANALSLFQRGDYPLNSYVVDFYTHNNYQRLLIENRIRDGDCWDTLKDWMLLLQSLTNSIVRDRSQFCEGLQFLTKKFRDQFKRV
eukprot:TRINITY_DN1961_c0_g1_i1.p1 TRINITY_DN1961_c0_g1~~TRINITY_DN1961_c0_g1_i1.p1  ORF type:complete len:247 (-),score=9.32 TRINITY_DN1961_c0_g1_i1:433-1173(-)